MRREGPDGIAACRVRLGASTSPNITAQSHPGWPLGRAQLLLSRMDGIKVNVISYLCSDVLLRTRSLELELLISQQTFVSGHCASLTPSLYAANPLPPDSALFCALLLLVSSCSPGTTSRALYPAIRIAYHF